MSASATLDDRLIPNTLLSCATILIYDWICTLDKEITHVWLRPVSTGTILFALNRYAPFIDIFVALSAKFQRISPEDCLTRNTIVAWFTVLGIYLSETILMLRTWALWGTQEVGLHIINDPWNLVTELEIRSLLYVPTTGVGCTLGKAGAIIIVAYILLLLLETSIVILTAIQAFRHLRYSREPWLIQLYRDGIVFYVYLLVISLANILVPILAPSMFSNWLASPQRVLHSVLCTRVLLRIRAPSHWTLFQDSIAFDLDESRGTVTFAR
ncbi:hypothetical protein MSAN_00977300 [Mycena sanguinolenta]|uniref:DUF6533 domain-containing protein n=1 Tax=Mycena sanguinolenta TaxID=230812 RepID=A0A8H6YYP3_9AGAR|nr:hypothetical protein MSAN_00977300 [Mycena sanguinolenta]